MATETAVDVVMPQMGVSVSEGTITKWLKQEGEHVEADESLLEISTDKVDTEVPSPASGTLTQIVVQEGETVEVGTKLAQIGGGGEGPEPQAEAAPERPAEPPQPATQQAADAAMAAASEGAGEVAPASQNTQAGEPAAIAAGNGRTFVSPVVARIASEHGVDVGQVPGTGRGGRVTKKDILNFIEGGKPPSMTEEEAAPPEPAAATAPPATPPPPQPPPAPRPAPEPVAAAPLEPGEQLEPVTAMRRGIAEHMRRSLDTSAHVTNAIQVAMPTDAATHEWLTAEH